MTDLPTIDMIATGANITAMRRRAGLSVRDLQDIFGFSTPQAIYKWQRGGLSGAGLSAPRSKTTRARCVKRAEKLTGSGAQKGFPDPAYYNKIKVDVPDFQSGY